MRTYMHIFVKEKPISKFDVLQWGVLSEEFKQAEILGQMTWCMHAHSLSHLQLFVTPWTPEAHQGPLSMGFSRQNSGVGCHVLLQGIFPIQGSYPQPLGLLHCRKILYC